MKYALVFLVVAIGFWLWQRNRIAAKKVDEKAFARNPAVKKTAALQMISCSVCGLHLPIAEARVGKRGAYCSEEHQRQVGD